MAATASLGIFTLYSAMLAAKRLIKGQDVASPPGLMLQFKYYCFIK